MKKRILSILICFCLMISNMQTYYSYAASTEGTDIIASGKCGTNVSWQVDSDLELVILGNGYMDDYSAETTPWIEYRDSIEKVRFAEGVTSVGKNAFLDHANLREVELSSTIELVDDFSFSECHCLETMRFTGDMPDFGENGSCFEGTTVTVYYPENTYWDRDALLDYGGNLSWVSYCLHSYEGESTVPTCTEDGYTLYRCVYCGDTYTDNVVAATGHQYEGTVTEPTCEDEGYTTYTCKNCGDMYIDNNVPASGHEYESVVTKPTCTESGYTTHICKLCGDKYTDNEVEAKGHQYGKGVVTTPTCTEKGYTEYTCAVCGEVYRDNETEEAGHQYGKGVVIKPTCTKKGYTEYTCTVCGEVYRDNETEATGHQYGKGVLTAPTCTEKGYTTFVCTVCGEEHVEDEVQALGHSFSHSGNNDGTHISTCSVCGYTETSTCIDRDNDAMCDDCGERIILGHGTCGEKLTWFLYGDNKLEITGDGEMENFESADAVPWSGFSSAITEIQLPDTLASIGSYAFYNCTSITRINVPEAVTRIGDYAYYGCSNAKGALNLPEQTEYIGKYAFANCSCLEGNLYIPASVKEILSYSFSGCRGLNGTLSLPDGVTVINAYAFNNCGFSGTLVVPDSVHYIDQSAFQSCYTLSEIVLGENLGVLSYYSFQGCYAVRKITFKSAEPPIIGSNPSETVTNQSYLRMFFGSLYQLEAIIVPQGTYGKYASTYGAVLTDSVRIREDTDTEFIIENGVLVAYMGEAEEIDVPDDVTEIGEFAFLNNSNIANVTFPDHDMVIGKGAFKGAASLCKITGTENINDIGEYAFYRCSSLKTVILGDSIVRIPDYCFYQCSSLEDVTISNQSAGIGNYTFSYCSNLRIVTLPETLEVIGNYAFTYCPMLDSVHFGKALKRIGTYAFRSSNIENLYIDRDLESINSNSFSGTSVSNVHFGKDVTSINGVFLSSAGLKEIEVDGQNNVYTSENGVLFDKSHKILNRFPPKKPDAEFSIPDSVQAIGNSAFSSCTLLKAVTIPVSTTSIGTDAFSGCTSLEKVYYKGDKLQWRLININTGNQWLLGATIFYNDQTEVGEDKSGWDGTISKEFGGGKGTSADPYLITNAEELAFLAQKVNAGTEYSGKYFRMTNDITMNATDDWAHWSETYAPKNVWTASIGISGKPFKGVFDGDNYSIYGLYTKQGGLFGYTYSATVKNLRIKESFVYRSASSTGAIVASSTYGTIENCINQGVVKGANYVGGIVGSKSSTTLKNCKNAGAVSGTERVGGIAGNADAVTSCINEGDVSGTTNVGGVVGYLKSSTISACVNSGEVNGNTNVGGIVGYGYQDFWGTLTIEKCENHGNVLGRSNNVGGIMGYAYADGAYGWYFEIRTTANFGEVKGTSYVGGIIGYGFMNATNNAKINDCYNIGNIKGTSVVGGLYGGGYLSWGSQEGFDDLYIYRSYSMGTVTGSSNYGAISYMTRRAYAYNTYYLDSSCSKSALGKSLTSAQMLLQSSYSGFDFSSVWQMDSNFGRPVLRNLILPTTLDSNYHLGSWDSSVDDYIIEEVKKYTSSGKYEQYDRIMSGNTNVNEKLRRLNELFINYGFTDVREGINYLSNTTSYRYDYLYLTTNESFCAFNYWDWLNSTIKGKFARGLLYADGLIFNYEALSYLDPATYVESEYPGVKKNKTLLKRIMESGNDSAISDVLSNSNHTAKYLKNILKLNGLTADAEMDILMDQIINCKSPEKLEELQNQFAEKIVHQIEANGMDRIYLDGQPFGKALGYAAKTLSIAGATVSDINDFVNLDRDIAEYQRYKKFLRTIYENKDVSWEMRAAAWSLLDDIENGYWNKLIHVLDEVISLEKEFMESKLVFNKSMMQALAEKAGVGSFGELMGDAIGTITFATFISNIIVDTGDFVKQVAYTQGYAELSALYSLKLQEDKEVFLKDPSAENAWAFFEDYTMLWNLRYQGEEQYLDMSSVKMYLFAKVKTYAYDEKKAVVQDNLAKLNECKFEVADTYTIPASVQYVKKAVVSCPVDVYVYTDSGELIATLIDGVESDVTNEYGRFAVVHESYTGEYAKVICLSTSEHLNYELKALSGGLVDYESCDGTDVQSFDKFEVEEGNTITIAEDSLSIDKDGNGESEEKINLQIKDENNYAKVSSITADIDGLIFDTPGSRTVKVTVLPENATNTTLTWVSMDEDVVTVKNGVITPVSKGETTVRVLAADGDEVELEIPVSVLDSAVVEKDDGRASLYGASLRLTGDIGVNFYYEFDNTMLQDENSCITVKVGEEEVRRMGIDSAVVDTKSVEGKTLYKFTAYVTAKQMYDPIVISAAGTDYQEKPHEYSIRKYADNILAKDKYSKELKYLVRVMMYYGASSQAYLNYNTSRPASLGMDLTDVITAGNALTADDLEDFVSQKTEMPEGISLYGANLSLKSETVLRHHFILEDGHELSEFVFSVGGREYTPVALNGRYCVEIENIRAQDLDEMFTVTVTDNDGNQGSITYGALTYVRNIIRNGTERYSQALIDTARSIYLYNKAAEDYLKTR